MVQTLFVLGVVKPLAVRTGLTLCQAKMSARLAHVFVCMRVCVGIACACTLVCLCKVLRNTVDTGQGHRLCFGQGCRIFSGVPKLQGMQSVAVMETIVFRGGTGKTEH